MAITVIVAHILVWLLMPATPQAQSPATALTPDLIRQLHSSSWEVRRDAFEYLAAVPKGTSEKAVKNLLIELLQGENKASNSPDPDLDEDDDYVAYNDRVTELVQQIAESSDEPGAWQALVDQRYNANSVFGQWLSDHCSKTLPLLTDQLRSRWSGRRMTSAYVVALCLSKHRDEIQASTYKLLHTKIRELADRDIAPVRQSSIEGLGLLKDQKDIPLLLRLSQTANDPYSQTEALAAIRQIEGKPALPIPRPGPS